MEPHGGSADDAARVEELMSHDDLGDNKWTDIWAKIAGLRSSRAMMIRVDKRVVARVGRACQRTSSACGRVRRGRGVSRPGQ